MVVDEVNANMPLDVAAKSTQAPQTVQRAQIEHKTEKLGGTQTQPELDAGPAYTVEISDKAAKLYEQSQSQGENADENEPAAEQATDKRLDSKAKLGKGEKRKEAMMSLAGYSDEQLEKMMEKGEISRLKYSVEMQRRETSQGSGMTDPKNDGKSDDTAAVNNGAESAVRVKKNTPERTAKPSQNPDAAQLANIGMKNREIDKQKNSI